MEKREQGHTSGPWEAIDGQYIVADMKEGAVEVARVWSKDACIYLPSNANANRIVAAVNACEGIPTEALEDGVVGELLEAIKQTMCDSTGAFDETCISIDLLKVNPDAVCPRCAVIAKATGQEGS